ncbi:MAG: thioredoxin [Clostridia bacterium]|nr:thioredoxin [Clostridia bacterium]
MSSRGTKKKAISESRPMQKQLSKEEQKKKSRQIWWATTGKKLVGSIIVVLVLTAVVVGIVLGTANGSGNNNNAINPSKPSFIDIGSTGCAACRQLQPVMAQLKADYGNDVNVLFYDAWYSTKGEEMAAKYKVSGIPTLIFVNANGKEVARWSGYHSYEEIVEKFQSLGWV